MTNREKLLTTNEYDTLVRMNENLTKIGTGRNCIMDVLTGETCVERCKKYWNMYCERCITDWLNEEAK